MGKLYWYQCGGLHSEKNLSAHSSKVLVWITSKSFALREKKLEKVLKSCLYRFQHAIYFPPSVWREFASCSLSWLHLSKPSQSTNPRLSSQTQPGPNQRVQMAQPAHSGTCWYLELWFTSLVWANNDTDIIIITVSTCLMFSRMANTSPAHFYCLVSAFFSSVINGVAEYRAYLQTSEAAMPSELKE